jgi:hypothetical protein
LQEELDVALLPIAAGLANVSTKKAEKNMLQSLLFPWLLGY